MTKSNLNGIIYAQCLLLRPTFLAYGGMILSYWLLSYLGLFSPEIAVAMGQLVMMLSSLALFSMEESSSFQEVWALFPSGREGLVVGRYLFVLGLTAVTTFVTLLLLILWSILGSGEIFSCVLALMLSTLLGLVFLELSLPLLFALGSRQGKPWFFLLVLTPVAFYVMVLPMLDEYLQERMFHQDQVSTLAWMILGIGLGLIGFFPSYLASMKIFQRKSLEERKS